MSKMLPLRPSLVMASAAALLGLSACQPGTSSSPAASTASAPAASAASAPASLPASGEKAQASGPQLPDAVRALVPAGWEVFTTGRADLDKDGQDDYALGLEAPAALKEGAQDFEAGARRLVLVTRKADGGYQVRATSDLALLCKECGGAYGDPFAEMKVGSGTLTLIHFGGSSMRWGHEAEFRWSRKDQAWQLVRYQSSDFNANDPEHAEIVEMKPPKDFGKIDLVDYDPDAVKGRGER